LVRTRIENCIVFSGLAAFREPFTRIVVLAHQNPANFVDGCNRRPIISSGQRALIWIKRPKPGTA
jgi:hypothetical protein